MNVERVSSRSNDHQACPDLPQASSSVIISVGISHAAIAFYDIEGVLESFSDALLVGCILLLAVALYAIKAAGEECFGRRNGRAVP